MMNKQYYVYIITNKVNSTLYTGVTSNLKRRIYEHREGIGGGFTKKYTIKKLVYYEITNDVHSALAREKQIKAGSRKRKVDLINSINSEWIDLYDGL
jgi:putative endonuclease